MAAVVGRHARLELAFERRAGRTLLARAYAEPPFRIGHSFDVDGAAYVILVCAAPGLFAGDCLRQHVTVGPGARVLLTSQSALQIHPADAPDAATMHCDYRVAEGGELHCQWDPVIPFAEGRLIQRVDLRIARDSRLYWSDALMSGRASRGEAWRFRSMDHELRLDVDGRLSYLERYRLVPSERSIQHQWRAGPRDYTGTMLVHHEAAGPALAESLQHHMSAIDGVAAGVDLIEPSLLVARLLGEEGVAWSRARARFREVVLASAFKSPGLVFRR